MSINVTVDIPAGRVDVERGLSLTPTDNGTDHLAATLRDVCNAVLRSYGLPPSMEVSTARLRLLEESKRATPRGGW